MVLDVGVISLSALHEQAVIPVADPQGFTAVRSAIEAAFSLAKVKDFLKSVARAGLRIRDFELVLRKGQIREYYLASLEKVAPELRAKFFKLYAYY
jgi:hypothetical protein